MDAQKISQRDAFGIALQQLGSEIPNLVVLSPDVGTSTQAAKFKTLFPERYICTGIAEQNTVGMAAGFATSGFIPLVAAFSIFLTGKSWEQIRTSVAYPHHNVKFVGTHVGLGVGPDGVSHQATEDIAVMRAIPGMVVLAPTDANQVKPVLKTALEYKGPVYIRLERPAIPILTPVEQTFRIGQSTELRSGTHAVIFSVGSMASFALKAAEMLMEEDNLSVRVISMVSLKPIDEQVIIQAAKDCGAVVTAEDHNLHGGLGSAVAETLVKKIPVPLEVVALQDKFGESGSPRELYEKYHMTPVDIAIAVRKVIQRKNNRKETE